MKNDKEKLKTDLKKRIYYWVLELIKSLDRLPKDTISQRIVDQLFRSGSSICANYIEAQAASSRKDFTNFLHYSLKSANESKFWLMVIIDTQRSNEQEARSILQELVEIANILGASILTAKNRR